MLYNDKQSFKKKSPFWFEFETTWSNNKITSFQVLTDIGCNGHISLYQISS